MCVLSRVGEDGWVGVRGVGVRQLEAKIMTPIDFLLVSSSGPI